MFRFGSIILAGGLLAAPAQAAVMQAVFTGVETYRSHEYIGESNQGAPVINDSEWWIEDYAGTPVTWVIRYKLEEPAENYNSKDEVSEYDYQLYLSNSADAVQFSQLTHGETVVFETPPGHSTLLWVERNRYVYFDDERNYYEGYGIGQQSEEHQYALPVTYLQTQVLSIRTYMGAVRELFPDSATQPFSIIFDTMQNGEGFDGEFNSHKNYIIVDSEGNNDGYQLFVDQFGWTITSLTVTRLDTEPSIPAVPLPASAPLLLAALGGLAALRRRKRV